MATMNPAPNTQRAAKGAGQKLLIDTGKMSVRRVTKNEASIMGALKSLAPVERATLVSLTETLQAKKRKRVTVAADSEGGHHE